MNITIIGGSKGTGAQLATIAIDADHDVTVVSRSGTAPAGARIVAGDATDADALREAITGTWRALEVSDEGTLSGSIPRGDVAACMLVSLGDDATIGKALGVSG